MEAETVAGPPNTPQEERDAEPRKRQKRAKEDTPKRRTHGTLLLLIEILILGIIFWTGVCLTREKIRPCSPCLYMHNADSAAFFVLGAALHNYEMADVHRLWLTATTNCSVSQPMNMTMARLLDATLAGEALERDHPTLFQIARLSFSQFYEECVHADAK